jgi:hypothetical protein
MKKTMLLWAILALAIAAAAHARAPRFSVRASLLDASFQFPVVEAPLDPGFRCDVTNWSMAFGVRWVMLGVALYQVSYGGSGYRFSSFLPLELVVPLFSWQSLFQGFLGEGLDEEIFRSSLGASVQWAWLAVEPEGRRLEARLEYFGHFVGAYVGTSYSYGMSTEYRPNLAVGVRVGALMQMAIDPQ